MMIGNGDRMDFFPEYEMSLVFLSFCSAALAGFAIFSYFMWRQLNLRTRNLAHSEQRYRSLFHHHPDAVFTIDLNGRFTELNPTVGKLLGYESDELMKTNYYQFLLPEDVETCLRNEQRLLNGEPVNQEFRILLKDGSMIHTSMTCIPIYGEQGVEGAYVISKDITEQKRAQEEIKHLAFHDELTGLPNRHAFLRLVDETVQETKRQQGKLAVLLLDLDRFKNYNDSLGHSFGDDLLKELTERLQACLRDGMVLARLGGDEFCVMYPHVQGPEEVIAFAETVLETVYNRPFIIGRHEVRISTSIGISCYPRAGYDADSLLMNADTAMYRAKEQRNGYQFYEPTMGSKLLASIVMETELQQALERGEFELHYQPKVDTRTLQILGAEALLRWRHPDKGLVSPADFIPLAEDTGLIVPMGEWVLRTACRNAKRWRERGHTLTVSVNLSLRQFEDPRLVQTVKDALAESGLDPRDLELEITESMTTNVERTNQVLTELKSLGLNVGIDDFGTGYSSLSYLTKFPLDRLKIDQSFVRHVFEDESNTAIVATIISMAKHLKLHVTAEGVETERQLELLRQLGCDDIQGYLISPPLPLEPFEQLLDDDKKRAASLTIA